MLCGGGKQFRNPQPNVCSMCSFGLRWQLKRPPHTGCHSYVPQTIQWQLILSSSCHLWSGPSSRENVSSRNEGCHLQCFFTAYYWAGSQWHLSKYRVRRWTWCNSTSTWGSISTTGWTGLIKYVVQEVTGYCSSKLSLLSVVDSTLFLTAVCKGENSKVRDAGRVSTKFQGKKRCFCCLNLNDLEERIS